MPAFMLVYHVSSIFRYFLTAPYRDSKLDMKTILSYWIEILTKLAKLFIQRRYGTFIVTSSV
jgi:hypothetical protein